MSEVALEVAQAEFERFVEEMDLDVDTADMDVYDITAFNKLKRRIIKAICRGALVINENGEAVYTPSNSNSNYREPITFHERTGATTMAMDGKKKGHDVAKGYAVMAAVTKLHPGVFAGLAGEDIKTCEAIFALLMD